MQDIEYRLVDPVIMPLCPGTYIGITYFLLEGAELFSCRDRYRSKDKTAFSQNGKGFLRNSPSDGFSRQIEQLFPFPSPMARIAG